MHDHEALEMMRAASSEIRRLRARIDALEPKADAYESVQRILGLLPQPSQGYGEDLAWRLDKRCKEIETKLSDEKQAAAAGG